MAFPCTLVKAKVHKFSLSHQGQFDALGRLQTHKYNQIRVLLVQETLSNLDTPTNSKNER